MQILKEHNMSLSVIRFVEMYVIPRSHLLILNERYELQTPAFYILLGEDEETKPKAYIGETENFRERVRDHESKKSFLAKSLAFYFLKMQQ